MKTNLSSSSPSSQASFLVLFVALSLRKLAVADDGFCSAASLESKHLYWNLTNPTLSPSHLQDLPGFTRSVYRSDHALITPESHVFLVLYPIGDSRSGLPESDVERFIFVVQGSVALTNVSGLIHKFNLQLLFGETSLAGKHTLPCVSRAFLKHHDLCITKPVITN